MVRKLAAVSLICGTAPLVDSFSKDPVVIFITIVETAGCFRMFLSIYQTM
jgi:hypothetical protein